MTLRARFVSLGARFVPEGPTVRLRDGTPEPIGSDVAFEMVPIDGWRIRRLPVRVSWPLPPKVAT